MDKQIIMNYLQIFILPLVLGVGLRLVLKRFSKAWTATVVFALLSAVWIILSIFGGGNHEANPLLALQSILAFAGSLITGIICTVIKKKKTNL